eukprot:TRINITY_DN10190_c0_g1_i1.p1 TRINITY_DN10190_c0_g1~~TRINITY_DN10190_c0_g1_i1.p1  ORF type:complete len:297 (+),score=36.15 TRINITY_DN10190_c0_g1_i1:129-893(+)
MDSSAIAMTLSPLLLRRRALSNATKRRKTFLRARSKNIVPSAAGTEVQEVIAGSKVIAYLIEHLSDLSFEDKPIEQHLCKNFLIKKSYTGAKAGKEKSNASVNSELSLAKGELVCAILSAQHAGKNVSYICNLGTFDLGWVINKKCKMIEINLADYFLKEEDDEHHSGNESDRRSPTIKRSLSYSYDGKRMNPKRRSWGLPSESRSPPFQKRKSHHKPRASHKDQTKNRRSSTCSSHHHRVRRKHREESRTSPD